MSAKYITAIWISILLSCATNSGAAPDDSNAERNDLSICSGANPFPTVEAPATAQQLGSWLNGSWVLRTRTIQGVAVDTDSNYYFDVNEVNGSGVRGWAMLIDRGNLRSLDYLRLCPACLANATVGALWKVTITSDAEGRSVHLKMDGDYQGSYGDFRKGVTATEQTHFRKYGSVFLAGQLQSPAGGQGLEDDTWDRISLTHSMLIYTSCKNGFVDRFVKVSDQRPTVAGAALPQAWRAIKASGTLVNPGSLEATQ